jgi:site-specific DNA-methyltransferase (adenine-specific)
MTPYYQDDFCTIYHGDCREILPNICADLIVADPNYGETSLGWDRKTKGWLQAVNASVRQLWCFGSMRFFLNTFSEFKDWKFAQEIIWEKQNGSGFHADRFKRVHEYALHFYRGTWRTLFLHPVATLDATARTVRRKRRPTHMGHIEQGAYISHDGGPRLMRSILRIRNCHGSAFHPTQKPLGIISPLILYSCASGGLVCEPFMGSGTALVAAKALGRRGIGIDIEECYCEIAARRMAQEVLDLKEGIA